MEESLGGLTKGGPWLGVGGGLTLTAAHISSALQHSTFLLFLTPLPYLAHSWAVFWQSCHQGVLRCLLQPEVAQFMSDGSWLGLVTCHSSQSSCPGDVIDTQEHKTQSNNLPNSQSLQWLVLSAPLATRMRKLKSGSHMLFPHSIYFLLMVLMNNEPFTNCSVA